MPRHLARQNVDEELAKPLIAADAKQYEHERWGLTPDAVAEAAHKDSIWGSHTYGEEVLA